LLASNVIRGRSLSDDNIGTTEFHQRDIGMIVNMSKSKNFRGCCDGSSVF
jgi:hypothetical protein